MSEASDFADVFRRVHPLRIGDLSKPDYRGHRAAQSAEVVDGFGHRNIVIDGAQFPYYTQGPLEVRPAEKGIGSIILIPLWVDGPVTQTLAEPPVDDE